MSLGVVRGGLAISGLYDLEPIRLNYLNEKLRLDEAEAGRNSPLLHLPTKAGSLVVAYGKSSLAIYTVGQRSHHARFVSRLAGPSSVARVDAVAVSGASAPAACATSTSRWPSRFSKHSDKPRTG